MVAYPSFNQWRENCYAYLYSVQLSVRYRLEKDNSYDCERRELQQNQKKQQSKPQKPLIRSEFDFCLSLFHAALDLSWIYIFRLNVIIYKNS